jgi:hypothetical protein
MNEQKVGLKFGALSPDISAQLNEQRIKYDKQKVNGFQKCADAITRLRFNDLLSDSQADKCFDKLMKKIGAHLAHIANQSN